MAGITYGKPEVFEEVLRRSGIRLQDYPWVSIHRFAFEACGRPLNGPSRWRRRLC
jgi:hypothetical protein